MYETLQLVSGMFWATEGEALLVDALGARGVESRLSRLSDDDLTSRDGVEYPVVVLLLPILGDNDLTDELRARLANLEA